MPEPGLARRLVRRVPGYRALQMLLDFGRGSERRHSALLRLRRQRALFQPFGTTKLDRYPRTFAFLGVALGTDRPVRLLSFGCSTGEEVTSLRRIFPDAAITGIDISPERIAVCRADLPPPLAAVTRFEVAASAEREADASYDAVLAMAVFRHARLERHPGDNDVIEFDRFEAAVADLARVVKPGGYLVLRHANFRFADTVVAADFACVKRATCTTPLFDRAGRRLPDMAEEEAVFRKR